MCLELRVARTDVRDGGMGVSRTRAIAATPCCFLVWKNVDTEQGSIPPVLLFGLTIPSL